MESDPWTEGISHSFNSELSEIEKKYSLSKATISRINQGKAYRRENIRYPLRPSNKRVYS